MKSKGMIIASAVVAIATVGCTHKMPKSESAHMRSMCGSHMCKNRHYKSNMMYKGHRYSTHK